MNHEFERDVAVIGAGRIGLPWAAVLAADLALDVTCIDVDEERVHEVSTGTAPFDEPDLDELMTRAADEGTLDATSDPDVVSDHKYVAFTINAPRNEMDRFLQSVRSYAERISDSQIVVNRTTLPISVIPLMREIIEDGAGDPTPFAVLPERLAEGKAITEIRTLPKIVGLDDRESEQAMRSLLEPLGSPIHFTEPRTAMFVKLIDNAYRDALFSIANQVAYVADVLGLDGHEAIDLANREYPRNEIPSPGFVGGKCLPKDPHFLMDATVCDQPTTPDLFSATRRTNASLPAYISTEVLKKQPKKVALLGLAYKAGVGDVFNSPAKDIGDILAQQGVTVDVYDPHVHELDDDLPTVLADADVTVIAVNHPEFGSIAPVINDHAPDGGEVYDVWGVLAPDDVSIAYDGFGINEGSPAQALPVLDRP